MRTISVAAFAWILSCAAQAQTVTITYEYDALGRLVHVEDPHAGNRSYVLDDAGNRSEMVINGTGGGSGGGTGGGSGGGTGGGSGGGTGGTNNPPAATDIHYFSFPGECFTLAVSSAGSDVDGDPIIFTSVSTGSITNSGASWALCTPLDPPMLGNAYLYVFTIDDQNGGSDNAVLYLYN